MKKQHTQALNTNNIDRGKKTLLLVGDQDTSNSLLIKILEQNHFQVKTISGDVERWSLATISADVILIDRNSNSVSIAQALDFMKLANCPILLLTDISASNFVNDRFMMECNNFILKPFSLEELSLRLQWALLDHQKNNRKQSHRHLTDPEYSGSEYPKRILKEPFYTIDEDAKQIMKWLH